MARPPARSVSTAGRTPLLRVKREPLSSQLAAQLRLAIFRGEMLPGARLTEEAVASQAQVSKSTVREAFQLLVREGLIKLVPMSGASVTTLGQQDVLEISEARIALETFAVRAVSAPHVALPDTERSLDHLASAIRAKRWTEIVDADVGFHRSILEATRNSRLLQFWQELEPQVRLYLSYHADEAYDLGNTLAAHVVLLAAVRSGEPDRAAEAFRTEIIKRTDVRLAFWKEARGT